MEQKDELIQSMRNSLGTSNKIKLIDFLGEAVSVFQRFVFTNHSPEKDQAKSGIEEYVVESPIKQADSVAELSSHN